LCIFKVQTPALFYMTKSVLLLASFLLLLPACSESFLYEKAYEPSNELWTYEEPLVFDFNIPDTSESYTFYLDIIHAVDYPFQNLYTKIKTVYPDQDDRSDVLSLELSNELGLWQGNCKSKYCKVRIPLQVDALFSATGAYQLELNQFTRRDSLPGLKSLALRIQ